jgi:hypothetical protein
MHLHRFSSSTKSGLATPVINQSAQADFVCVAAISIAVAKGGNKGGFGISRLQNMIELKGKRILCIPLT